MADFPDNPVKGLEPTTADEVTDTSMVPTDDAAGGPQADPDAEIEEMSDEEAAAQLGQQI